MELGFAMLRRPRSGVCRDGRKSDLRWTRPINAGNEQNRPLDQFLELIARFIISTNSVCWVSSADLSTVAMDSTLLAPYIVHSVLDGVGIWYVSTNRSLCWH